MFYYDLFVFESAYKLLKWQYIFFLQLNIGSRIDLWQMLSSLKSSDNASKSCWLESTHSHFSWINGMGMFIKSENKYGH